MIKYYILLIIIDNYILSIILINCEKKIFKENISIILMNKLWEIFNEIGYKVKDINYLIPNNAKLEKKYNESKLNQNFKNVYIYNEDDEFYLNNNGRTIKICFTEQFHPHKSFFHKFVLENHDMCNICYETKKRKIACRCGYITCCTCFKKIKECPQCRNEIKVIKNV